LESRFADNTIIRALQERHESEPEILDHLYQQAGEAIIQFVQSNSGNKEDAEDVLQEGLHRMIVNIRNGEFNQKSTVKTYLFSICRNIWIGRLRRANKWREIQKLLSTSSVYSPSIELENQQRSELIAKALKGVNQGCRNVLTLWAFGYSMREIARKSGYKNAEMAKKKKHLCMKKLIISVKNRPELLQELMNYL